MPNKPHFATNMPKSDNQDIVTRIYLKYKRFANFRQIKLNLRCADIKKSVIL